MSLIALVEVFKKSESTLAARLVLLALADHADDDGSKAFPAVSTIAAKTKLSGRTVQRALRALERACEIVPTGSTKWGTTVYHLTVVSPLSSPLPVDRLLPAHLRGGDILTPEVSSRGPLESSGGAAPPDFTRSDRRPPGDNDDDYFARLRPGSLEWKRMRWLAWSNANPEVTNVDVVESVLLERGLPEAEIPILIEEHLQRGRHPQ